MVEAWAYLRKSRAEEGEADILWKHRAALQELAESDGVVIRPDHWREEIGSGDNIKSRPEFRAQLDEWRSLPPPVGPIRRICYVMQADRLSRGVLTERGQVQDILIGAGIVLRTPGGWCDLADPDQLLLHEVKGSLARHELLRYKDRVEKARLTMTRQGLLLTGRPPYGYKWSKDEFLPQPDPRLFPLLVDACERVLTTSVLRLALEYGVDRTVLNRALRNPMIAGYPCRKWRSTPEGDRRLSPDEWVWPEQAGDYPAACSLEQWHRIQQALTERCDQRAKTGTADNWCVDVIRFTGYSERPKCSAAHGMLTYSLRHVAPHLHVARFLVHEAAAAAIDDLLADEKLLTLVATEGAVQASQPVAAGPRPTLGCLEKQRGLLARLKALEGEGDEEDQIANRAAQADTKREIERLKRELERERAPRIDARAHEALVELTALGGDWQKAATTAEKRVLARGLLSVEITIINEGMVREGGTKPRYGRRVAISYAPPLFLDRAE